MSYPSTILYYTIHDLAQPTAPLMVWRPSECPPPHSPVHFGVPVAPCAAPCVAIPAGAMQGAAAAGAAEPGPSAEEGTDIAIHQPQSEAL